MLREIVLFGLFFCLGNWAVEAKEVVLPHVGVAFSIPDSWKHDVKEESGRVGILVKPTRDESDSSAVRCRIDRHELPVRFRSYTQQQLNDAYAGQPLNAEGFAERLKASTGVPVSVTAVGSPC
jgi:hypothetical protein